MRVRRFIKIALCICFFLLSAVLIYFFSDSGRPDEPVFEEFKMDAAKGGAIKKLLEQRIRGTFPLVDLAAMDSYDEMLRSNWAAALFSDAFYINELAGHEAGNLFLAENENKEALAREENKKKWLLPENFLKIYGPPGEVERIHGESYFEEAAGAEAMEEGADPALLKHNRQLIQKLMKSRDTDYLVQNFFILSGTTAIDKTVFNVDKLLDQDCTMEKKPGVPQILIYHTHGASEYFSDSRDQVTEDSVIGVGEYLAEILSNQYGYGVIHDETPYDRINGSIDRNKAYNKALDSITKTLEENPTIEVVIDLHRDASRKGEKRVTTVNGKPTAQVMFFNGLSRNLDGNIAYLKNPNLAANLAFSLQMKLESMKKYPDFAMNIFLKGYRYNLHVREKALLIELGNNANTIAEARNAMEPLAEVLNEVLGD